MSPLYAWQFHIFAFVSAVSCHLRALLVQFSNRNTHSRYLLILKRVKLSKGCILAYLIAPIIPNYRISPLYLELHRIPFQVHPPSKHLIYLRLLIKIIEDGFGRAPPIGWVKPQTSFVVLFVYRFAINWFLILFLPQRQSLKNMLVSHILIN